jgi:hypothetical protein
MEERVSVVAAEQEGEAVQVVAKFGQTIGGVADEREQGCGEPAAVAGGDIGRWAGKQHDHLTGPRTKTADQSMNVTARGPNARTPDIVRAAERSERR